MGTANRVLAIMEEGLAAGLLATMLVTVFGGVVLRYGFNSPIGWSDELAKISFTWLVFVGGALGVRRGVHIGIDALVAALPPSIRRATALIADLLVIIVLIVFVYYGILLVQMTASVMTPSMRISVGLFVYAAAPFGALLMTYHQLQHVATKSLSE